MNFNGRSVLVVGSNSDLAQPLYEKLLNSKKTLLTYNEKKDNLERFNFSKNDGIRFTKLDLTKVSEVESFLDKENYDFDLIIFCPGITDEYLEIKGDLNIEIINNVNYLSIALMLNYFCNFAFINNRKLDVICISSISGIRGRNKNQFYSASKSALNSITSSLRQKYCNSMIEIFTVIPGYIDTRMIKHQKTPKILTVSPKNLWKKIFSSVKKKRNIIYPNLLWRIISITLRLIPEKLFSKLNF